MSSPLPLFYKKVMPLNKAQHKGLYIEPIESFSFAAETNSLYVAVSEFPRAVCEYPVVFAKDEKDSVFPVALLGLKRNQNLFVTKSGEWVASYIPAYARRYPFILASDKKGGEQFTVCIDEGYPGFNTAKEGEPLFDKNGKQTEVLDRAVEFLKAYQAQVKITEEFCGALVELDVLEPVQANVEVKSGEKFAIGGFLCVNKDKLKALPAKKLTEMVKNDYLELCYLHLASLNMMNKLTGKLNPPKKSGKQGSPG